MDHGYVFIGGVDVSEACLAALCELGLLPSLAVGYDGTRVNASGYRDLRPLAERYGFQLETTGQINDVGLVRRIAALDPSVIFVIGWSQLIKRDLLDCPRHGCVGIHPTDLPQGRGRAPIPWTIIKGLDRTASTMFFLTEGVDDGDVVGRVPVVVDPRETAATLYAKHRAAHVALVQRHAADLMAGTASREPQDHDRATYWETRRPEDGRIDPGMPVMAVDRLVRAVSRPFPGAFIENRDGTRLLVWSAEPTDSPGLALGAIRESARGSVLQCSDGGLLLLETELRTA